MEVIMKGLEMIEILEDRRLDLYCVLPRLVCCPVLETCESGGCGGT